jgi:pyruvate-ferredoxin/flavodoxin oxidoreductase
MKIPAGEIDGVPTAPTVSALAPDFVKRVTGMMLAGKGDLLPVSAFPVDGTWPSGTAKWEKRNIAQEIPVWNESICIQCNKCALVCPHAAIRPKFYAAAQLDGAPGTFKSADFRSQDYDGCKYTLQVAPEDCTGCTLCVQVCPVKDKAAPGRKAINMEPQLPLRDAERANYEFFLDLPEADRTRIRTSEVKSSQFLEPLFEFSGACAGCGETSYIKLLTQLFGDRAYIANATGCSSIYGGNLPTTPYTTDCAGRGPAWSNSLFEDNAEYGLGVRFAIDQQTEMARELVQKLAPQIGDTLAAEILNAVQVDEAGLAVQRERVTDLRAKLVGITDLDARRLELIADALVRKSVWIVGGDGWAYDIGFGGLDHVLSLGRDVNILVLDTEVYSNTGGQQSKSTPLSATAKFATAGKVSPKKDLGLIAMSYGSVYVARVALGAKDSQTVKALAEAESFPGTSLILAYSHCIAHGYAMSQGLEQQKLAVDCGTWPLYRFDPRREDAQFQLDSGAPKVPVARYLENELRFRMIEKSDPERYRLLQAAAQEDAERRWKLHQDLVGSKA